MNFLYYIMIFSILYASYTYTKDETITIEQELDELLALPAENRLTNWQDSVDNHVLTLSVIDLEKLIALPQTQKNEQWKKNVNSLLFDIALYNKQTANDYLEKIYKQLPTTTLPVFGGPPPPPLPGGPPAPPKLGGPPPPPPLPGMGPKPPTGGPQPPSQRGTPAIKKIVITPNALNNMTEEEVEKLFNEHVASLEKNWDEKELLIEVKVKSHNGFRTVKTMERGRPDGTWSNQLRLLQNSLAKKNIMPMEKSTEIVNEQINKVRREKLAVIAPKTAIEEKTTTEDTKENIENNIKSLLNNAKKTEMAWLSGTKRAIQALNKFDHEAALKYQELFINASGEKRFIKP